MILGLSDFKTVFFIGIAGTGMSAIAQYLAGNGKQVSGSDRYFLPDELNDTREKLEALGIQCFLQNGEGISKATDLVVVSTAVEDTVPEVQKAAGLNIPIIKRSELLALIAASKKNDRSRRHQRQKHNLCHAFRYPAICRIRSQYYQRRRTG